MKKLNYLIIAGLFLVSVSAKPNLPNVDYAALFFQGTTSAHPIKKVTALPATCVAVGGANSSNAILYQGRIYICSSTDTWTATSTGSGTVTSVGLILGTSGTDAGVSGSPITGSGSFTLNLQRRVLQIGDCYLQVIGQLLIVSTVMVQRLRLGQLRHLL